MLRMVEGQTNIAGLNGQVLLRRSRPVILCFEISAHALLYCSILSFDFIRLKVEGDEQVPELSCFP